MRKAAVRRPILPLALASLLAPLAVAAQPAAGPPNAAHGKALFLADGCYQCHGTSGEGAGNTGPKLAPDPLALEDFEQQLRNPRNTMPVYTAKVLPRVELLDIYAYLQSIPKAKPVADIPLLNR